jgi:hypothetical protein
MHSNSLVFLHFLDVSSSFLPIYLFSFAAIALMLASHPNNFIVWQIHF